MASSDANDLLVKSELQIHVTGTEACDIKIFIKNMEEHSKGVYYERQKKPNRKATIFCAADAFLTMTPNSVNSRQRLFD